MAECVGLAFIHYFAPIEKQAPSVFHCKILTVPLGLHPPSAVDVVIEPEEAPVESGRDRREKGTKKKIKKNEVFEFLNLPVRLVDKLVLCEK